MNRTYEEMKMQYPALQKTYEAILSQKDKIKAFVDRYRPGFLLYLGCGSGYCLCQSGELQAMARLGISAAALPAGDVLLNPRSYGKLYRNAMVMAPSRSGSTSEVIRGIEEVKAIRNIPVFAVSCVEGSALSRMADYAIELPWAYDNSVCQTRTVTNLYVADLMVIAILAEDEKLLEDIGIAIRQGDRFIARYEDAVRAAAGGDWDHAVILADGEMQGIAAEAAVAFTEIAQIHAHYHHLLDVRHGPMVLVDKATLVIACLGAGLSGLKRDLVKEMAGRGARVITYSDRCAEKPEGAVLHLCSGVELDPAAQGIPFIFISQMAAVTKAAQKGINPDNPDGLAAWVRL